MLHSVIEAIITFVLAVINTLGYGGIFFLSLLESANIPIPSEVVLPFSGFLVSQGSFNFWVVVFMGAFGNLAGSLISYGIAYKYGRPALAALSKIFLFNEDHFNVAESWFRRFGQWSVFLGRFVPVVRTFISFPAGLFKVSLWRFSALTFIGSWLWSLFLAYLGFVLGENWTVLGGYFRQFDYIIAGAIVLLITWWAMRHFWHNKESR